MSIRQHPSASWRATPGACLGGQVPPAPTPPHTLGTSLLPAYAASLPLLLAYAAYLELVSEVTCLLLQHRHTRRGCVELPLRHSACQYLYFCTSKTSKLRNVSVDFSERFFLCTSKASKLRTFVPVKQVNCVPSALPCPRAPSPPAVYTSANVSIRRDTFLQHT